MIIDTTESKPKPTRHVISFEYRSERLLQRLLPFIGCISSDELVDDNGYTMKAGGYMCTTIVLDHQGYQVVFIPTAPDYSNYMQKPFAHTIASDEDQNIQEREIE